MDERKARAANDEGALKKDAKTESPGLAQAYGALRGRIVIAEDFDELPEDIAEALGASDPP